MEALPTETSPTPRAPIRLQMTEDPSDTGAPGSVRVLLGGERCPQCLGTGIIKMEPDPANGIKANEVCELCNGDGNDPANSPVDILPSLERFQFEASSEGAYANLVLRADIGPVDFHIDSVTVVDETNPLVGLTADELSGLVVRCPTSTNMGEWLLSHLQNRQPAEPS